MLNSCLHRATRAGATGPGRHAPELFRGTVTGRGTAIAAVLLALALGTSGCSDSGESVSLPAGGAAASAAGSGTGPAAAAHPSPVRSTLPAWGKDLPQVAPARVGPVSQVARAAVPTVTVYRTATDTKPWMTLTNPLPSKAPRVFLVQDREGDRLRVLLPVRPNQSQGWIKASDVTISQHEFRIVVSIGEHTLTLYRGSTVVMQEKAGLGTASTPTPGGVYFTKELLKPSDPKGAYGPYAYGLSGYSPVLNEFLGGDGALGIHGTDDPTSLGKSVSHGCIRISNTAITKLAGMLPLGVPVQIVR